MNFQECAKLQNYIEDSCAKVVLKVSNFLQRIQTRFPFPSLKANFCHQLTLSLWACSGKLSLFQNYWNTRGKQQIENLFSVKDVIVPFALFFTVSFSEELTKKLSILLKCRTKLVSAKPRDSSQFGVAASSDQKPCHLCFQQTLALLEESVWVAQ